MRCPDCAKFVPYDEPQAEVDNETCSQNNIELEVRIVRPCGECGTELDEATVTLSAEVTCPECKCEVKEKEEGAPAEEEDPEAERPDPDDCIELVSTDVEVSDYYKDTDRHGKKITKQRYMTHMYTVNATCDCKCVLCGHEWTEELSEEITAGEFQSLV